MTDELAIVGFVPLSVFVVLVFAVLFFADMLRFGEVVLRERISGGGAHRAIDQDFVVVGELVHLQDSVHRRFAPNGRLGRILGVAQLPPAMGELVAMIQILKAVRLLSERIAPFAILILVFQIHVLLRTRQKLEGSVAVEQDAAGLSHMHFAFLLTNLLSILNYFRLKIILFVS